MKSMQGKTLYINKDLTRKRKMYQLISLIMIILDLLTFSTMETLDISYTLQNEDYQQLLSLFILKIIVMVVFIAFLFSLLILQFLNTLLISSIAYLVIGVVLFCYMLIDQLKSLHGSVISRPISYFENNIDSLIIVLNVLTGIFRITGGVMIMFFIMTLKTEKRRTQAEKDEVIIKLNDSLKNSEKDLFAVNDNKYTSLIKAEEEKEDITESKGKSNESELKNSKNPFRKTSLISDSADSYRKFETPKTSRLSYMDKN